MRTITMTEFRKEPGERIVDVVRNRDSFLLTKAGKAVAALVPVSDANVTTVIKRDGTIQGPAPLTLRRHLGGGF
jgi:antitoxin (DNA-binding transcriptional repressor) of toxin-antitoxin stability system